MNRKHVSYVISYIIKCFLFKRNTPANFLAPMFKNTLQKMSVAEITAVEPPPPPISKARTRNKRKKIPHHCHIY